MTDTSRFARPTYTSEQLSQFYDLIKLPKSIRSKIHSPDFAPDLSSLQTLQLYTVTSIPFECLSLHYSTSKKITISPDFLFSKIVSSNNGRGGYCMENNTLFGTVLRSIGYTAYPVGARVNSDTNETSERPYYFAWSHMVNIIVLEGVRYLIDVGFGANGPHHPLPLTTEAGKYPMRNVGPSQIRLIHEPLPDMLDQTQKHWIVQHRYNDQARWITAYATPAIEFLERDFEMMNLSTSTGPGLFTENVICTLLLRAEGEGEGEGGDGEGEAGRLVGDLTLMNWDLKERRDGRSKVVQRFESEKERVEGIERWFGIAFGEEEKGAAGERWGGREHEKK